MEVRVAVLAVYFEGEQAGDDASVERFRVPGATTGGCRLILVSVSAEEGFVCHMASNDAGSALNGRTTESGCRMRRPESPDSIALEEELADEDAEDEPGKATEDAENYRPGEVEHGRDDTRTE